MPEIAPGCAGKATTDAASVCDAPEPQALDAETAIAPDVPPTVAVMLLPVELPDHPDGRDQA